jgi:radical SAM superfamily enzyme YgiQ (UPF0313 family)
MDVALIYVDEDFKAFGLRCISSTLKKAGHRTRLILLKSKEDRYSKKTLAEIADCVRGCELAGISCLSRASGKAVQVLDAIRPLVGKTAWGGIYATLAPGQCAEHADVVCRGEGEGFILDFVDKLEKGEPWQDIPNAAYFENGDLKLNAIRPMIPDLDVLPMMDFGSGDEYHLEDGHLVRIDPATVKSDMVSFNGTRGCDFFCTYCSNAKQRELYGTRGRYARRLSIGEYIRQLEELKRIFPGVKCFNLYDEDFFARNTGEIAQFADAYTERIGLPFECMVSPVMLNREKMECLVKAGLWRINMGIESGSERTKKEVYNRHMSNDRVMEAARIINRHPHVIPVYFFIIGNPYETSEDLLATIRFIRDLPQPFFLRTYNLVFFLGSLLYDSAVRDGLIAGIEDSGYDLDFLSGLNYGRHAWKKKNLYLNGLLYLMSGQIGRRRLEFVPRAWVDFLIQPGVVAFNDKHEGLIKGLIRFKTSAFKVRHAAASLVKSWLEDPTSVYHIKEKLTGGLKKRSV